jgi:isopentenyldiphosphate isomerase
MSTSHYTQQVFIAEVDRNDTVIGLVERWRAHTENILHRAFSVVITYQNNVFLQHRKHPLFDGWFDLTIASHQIYENGQLEDDQTAVKKTLRREWNIEEKDLATQPKYLGKIYYHAEDTNGNASGYLDHATASRLAKEGKHFHEQEFDWFYHVEVKNIVQPNYDYCYGWSLVPLKDIISGRNHLSKILAPWVQKALAEKIFSSVAHR